MGRRCGGPPQRPPGKAVIRLNLLAPGTGRLVGSRLQVQDLWVVPLLLAHQEWCFPEPDPRRVAGSAGREGCLPDLLTPELLGAVGGAHTASLPVAGFAPVCQCVCSTSNNTSPAVLWSL